MGMTRRHERTLAREAEVRGIGFLTGADVRLRFRPAEPGTGIVFVRTDLPGQPAVAAHIENVVSRQRRTTIQQAAATVEMIEHVMAALAGLQIDNCRVELDAAETPGCDGSSAGFVGALKKAGIAEQAALRQALLIEQPVTVCEGAATLTAHPGPTDRLILTYNLDYGPHRAIGRQSRFFELVPGSFERELASSRTFLLEAEAVALRQAGVGVRTTEADLLIFGCDGPIGNELRYADECVRHKILDLVGDLALLGRDLVGHVVAHRSGHQLNAALVRKLLQAVELPAAEPRPTLPLEPAGDLAPLLKILPHRYPLVLVDRIVEHESGRRVRAHKLLTGDEPFFQGPGQPIMPGVLLLEALAQTAAVLVSQGVDSSIFAALMVALDGVKLGRPVVPGDQLVLEVLKLRSKNHTAEVQATARVGDQIAAEATIRFAIVEKQRAAG